MLPSTNGNSRDSPEQWSVALPDLDDDEDNDGHEGVDNYDAEENDNDDDEDHSDESDDLNEFDELDIESNYGSESDEYAEFRWLEQMDGIATLNGSETPQQIGYCNCKLIRRPRMRDVFYAELEQPSVETSVLAYDLFDRCGRLRREFKTHPVKRGSGIWQNEIDEGDLLLFEYVRIDEAYRRRGLGKRLFTAMLDMARKKSKSFFAIVQPSFLTRDIREQNTRGYVVRRESGNLSATIQRRHRLFPTSGLPKDRLLGLVCSGKPSCSSLSWSPCRKRP
jgi:GNAT superfamily N-acetyltransferase